MIEQALHNLSNVARNMVTRGKLLAGTVLFQNRAMIQVRGFDNETLTDVELLQPYGMSSNPVTTGRVIPDIVMVQVGGARDHVVAIHCDDGSLRIADLASGEYGFRDQNEAQVVFRKTGIEIIQPKSGNTITVTAAGDIVMTSQTNVNITATSTVNVHAADVTLTGSDAVSVISSGTVTVTAAQIKLN